jgi:type I restriction enzyme S subunit
MSTKAHQTQRREAESETGLPEGWALTVLGILVAPSKDKVEPRTLPNVPYLSLEHVESNTNRIIGHGLGKDVKSTKASFHAGDVLYGKLRPYLNKVCIPRFNGICSTDFLVFAPTAALDSHLLMWFLSQRYVVELANHESKGVELPRVSFDVLAELDFPLPPRAEQERIVRTIDEVLREISSTRVRFERAGSILKRFRQSVLTAACSGKLTEDWRKIHTTDGAAAELLKEIKKSHEAEGLGHGGKAADPTEDVHTLSADDVPDNWSIEELKWLCAPGRPITYGILKPGPNQLNGIPYVRV